MMVWRVCGVALRALACGGRGRGAVCSVKCRARRAAQAVQAAGGGGGLMVDG
jgi:hypothetical protein